MCMAGPCGQGCRSLLWWRTHRLKPGPSLWQYTMPSLGTALLKYLFTVDYAENEIADDPAQHKQSHVMELLDAGEWTGNIVALPNNRVRVTHPAWFETGSGAPDFKPSQHIHYSKSDLDYTLDVNRIFDNLYADSGHDTEDE